MRRSGTSGGRAVEGVNGLPGPTRILDPRVADPVAITLETGQVLEGRVIDEEGRGVGGVGVNLWNEDAQWVTFTRRDGTFRLLGLAPRTHGLAIVAPEPWMEVPERSVEPGHGPLR